MVSRVVKKLVEGEQGVQAHNLQALTEVSLHRPMVSHRKLGYARARPEGPLLL